MDYPMIVRDTIDFTSDSEVCNIGYNEGTLTDERPYRVELWNSYGITSATMFISIIGLEEMTEDQIKKMLVKENLIEIIKDQIYITEVEDINDNVFLSINIPLEGTEEINKLLVKVKDYDFE